MEKFRRPMVRRTFSWKPTIPTRQMLRRRLVCMTRCISGSFTSIGAIPPIQALVSARARRQRNQAFQVNLPGMRVNRIWRWMGSVAMDHSGNFAAGYSASGPNQFPSLFYAGRLANDPLGDLTQGEAVLFAGLGIEVNTGIFPFRNRWGDYSAITVDP